MSCRTHMMSTCPGTGVSDILWVTWKGLRDDGDSIAALFLKLQSSRESHNTCIKNKKHEYNASCLHPRDTPTPTGADDNNLEQFSSMR